MTTEVDIVTETVIRRPIEEVAAYASNPDHAPEWYANIRSVKWLTPPPLAVGTRLAFAAGFLGRQLAYTYQVAEFEPGRRLVMKTADGPFPMETTYTWEPTDDGATRMTLRNRGLPSGFARFTAPALVAAMRHANTVDLDRLKKRLEGHPER